MNQHKIILSLCDHSGNWPLYYREAGYDVRCFDLKHGQDVRLLECPGKVYGVLAAPPCTVFANSGARWPRTTEDMLEGLSVLDACLRIIAITKPVFWALENPIGKLKRYLGEPRMMFNPCDFGDPYTKRTCLWGTFIPPVGLFTTTEAVAPTEGSKMHALYGGKSERTKELRSVTPLGFAKAFFESNR